jgi:hypothetical protein
VRLTDDQHGCSLSFNALPDVPQKDALERGFAIDGHSYEMVVTACIFPDMDHDFVVCGSSFCNGSHGNTYRPLANVLRDTQLGIMEWLSKYGYEMTFAQHYSCLVCQQ